jgi:hypothetical protein
MKLSYQHKRGYTIQNVGRPIVVLNMGPSKAYDRVSWTFLKFLLIHIGFDLPMVN